MRPDEKLVVVGGECILEMGVNSGCTNCPRSGLTGNLHEMENRYGKTVRSTSEELSSNRKSAGTARIILESKLK